MERAESKTMRLCNALIQYFLGFLVILTIYSCYGHEHLDQIDPVSTKYSQPPSTIDPLNKQIETDTIQKHDFQKHDDDEHDTIEARLRAKHNLRQSVHQHSTDNEIENEADYINRLNSALEDDYHAIKPNAAIVDTIHNTSAQNQPRENAQPVITTENQTASLNVVSNQAPSVEQQIHNVEVQSSTQAPPILEPTKHAETFTEKSHTQIVSGETLAEAQVPNVEQTANTHIHEQNIKTEQIVSETSSHQQVSDPHELKPTSNPVSQEPVADIISNETQQHDILNGKLENVLTDTKSSVPTPLEQPTLTTTPTVATSIDNKSPSSETSQSEILNTITADASKNGIPPASISLEQPIPTTTPATVQIDAKIATPTVTIPTDIKPPSPVPTSAQPEILKTTVEDISTNSKPSTSTPNTVPTDNKFPSPELLQPEILNATTVDASANGIPSISTPIEPTILTTTPATLHVDDKIPTPTVTLSTDINRSSTIPVQPEISNTTPENVPKDYKLNEKAKTTSTDVNPNKQQETSEIKPVDNVENVNLKQLPSMDSMKNSNSLEQQPLSPTPKQSDQEKQISESTQSISSPDHKDEHPEIIVNRHSIDQTTSITPKNEQSAEIPPSTIENQSSTIPTSTTTTPTTTMKILSPTSPRHQKVNIRPRHVHHHHHHHHPHSHHEHNDDNHESEGHSTTEQQKSLDPVVPSPTVSQMDIIVKEYNNSIESLSNNESSIQPNTDQVNIQSTKESLEIKDSTDLPRQIHIHNPDAIHNHLHSDQHEKPTDHSSTAASFLTTDHTPHLPRTYEQQETTSTTTIQTTTNSEMRTDPTNELHETNKFVTSNTNSMLNQNESMVPTKFRQICWRLPTPLEPSLNLLENQITRFINLSPDFVQTILFESTKDRETLMNTMWFGSICSISFLFSLIFLSMATRRLKQSKHEKEIRARCQQLQQFNNQIELERATFERQNQKLSDEIDELKNLPVRDSDEEIFELRETCEQYRADWSRIKEENDTLLTDIDHKQNLIRKYEYEMQKQIENVAHLNDEIVHQKQALEKERETINRLQSNELTLEQFDKLQEIINELKSEITQVKQEKFVQTDQLKKVQEHADQLDIDNNELTMKLKQLKDIVEQKDETIIRLREKLANNEYNDEDEDEKSSESENVNNNQQELLINIDNNVEKANQHMRDLHSEINEKTSRIKELDSLLNQEKDRCRELETKLKVVLELRERDAHLHIRQLGQTDAELRKARTDTERVRILQQQLELKQKQLDDVQKVLSTEQTKYTEECGKLQHEIHEKWMEVKRLTRELEGAKKESESLRRQITKYANNERSSQEKTMHKPVAQHLNNTAQMLSDPENSSSSPPLNSYQQGENFRPIDRERNDSGAASPAEMLRIRPPVFGLPRPPFFPPPFLPPPNPFMMGPRFPMPMTGPHGMISPIPHLITNGSAGGSDTNSFEIVDSVNITPNSTSYDAPLNGSAVSPTPDDETQATTKSKKPKKSLKKKTKLSTTNTVSPAKEDV